MPQRLDKTAADYIALAVSPALIMTLVGSLTFFLLEVFYQGQYEGRLQYILGSFVFAAVLIGRIAIEEGKQRASMFAIALGSVTALAIARYVEHRGPLAAFGIWLDLALLGVIWWCAHRLTWDCTLIDEQQDASGEGLLQTIGLDEGDEKPAEALASRTTGPRQLEGTAAEEEEEEVRPSFWRRLFSSDEGRPHAPGLSVVYFSLAALPIFGIGQLLVPVGSAARRQYVFMLMAVYVASGLGLLLTTSFLGMRRYLRQRYVEMPGSIAGKWIAVGCGLALGLLVLAIILPRPNAEFAISSPPKFLRSPDRDASRHAPGGEGAKDKESKSTGGTDEKQKIKADEKTDGKGSAETKKPGEGKGKGESSKQDDSGKSSSNDKGKQKNGSSGKEKSQAPSKENTKQTKETKKAVEKKAVEKKAVAKKTPRESPSQPPPQSQPASNPIQKLTESFGSLGNVLKWILYAIVIAAILYLAWRYRAELRQGIANFIEDLRNLWASLFGGKEASAKEEEAEVAVGPRRPSYRPFADYPNPFASGAAGRWSAEELIAYTFEALEAWGREHGYPRDPDETPQEYSAQLARGAKPIAKRIRRLALLYSQVAYAPGTVVLEDTDELEQLWRELARS